MEKMSKEKKRNGNAINKKKRKMKIKEKDKENYRDKKMKTMGQIRKKWKMTKKKMRYRRKLKR